MTEMTEGQKEKFYAFISQYIDDYKKLESVGFAKKDIKRMLAKLLYVRAFIDNPIWLYQEAKLPKGYKWRDDAVIKLTGNYGEKYSFYPIGNDLYIRPYTLVGYNTKNNKIARAENYRELTTSEFAYGLKEGVQDIAAILWRQLGLSLCYTEPILRDIGQKRGSYPITGMRCLK